MLFSFFFFNDTATTEIYTLSLHDALPISLRSPIPQQADEDGLLHMEPVLGLVQHDRLRDQAENRLHVRSEEHTSELQSLAYLVCRLLLEKKKISNNSICNSERIERLPDPH